MGVAENNPFGRVAGRWEQVIADMETTANEYRADGFSVLELHPGDVTALVDESYGFDILVPGDEYEAIKTLADETSFESYEIYRAEATELTFLLVVLKDLDDEHAVCCPVYYDEGDAEEMIERARENGVMYTHIRPLSDDRAVTLSYEDPERFVGS